MPPDGSLYAVFVSPSRLRHAGNMDVVKWKERKACPWKRGYEGFWQRSRTEEDITEGRKDGRTVNGGSTANTSKT